MVQAQQHVGVDDSAVTRPPARRRARPTSHGARRVGYVAAILVNLVGLWFVDHLLEWGWPAFLTPSFEDLRPYVVASIVVSIAANAVWCCWDPQWLRHVGQLAVNAVSFLAAVRTWQIFPFDFTGDWSGWATVGRIMIVGAGIGIAIDTIVRLLALGRGDDGR